MLVFLLNYGISHAFLLGHGIIPACLFTWSWYKSCLPFSFGQIILGRLGFGVITTYMPEPMVSGFTSAVAVQIITAQAKHIFGLHVVRHNGYYKIIKVISQNAYSTSRKSLEFHQLFSFNEKRKKMITMVMFNSVSTLPQLLLDFFSRKVKIISS